jgi:heme-degrading monooxygenase HmoA
MRLERGIEHPDTYLLVVEWETLEDHEVHFRQSTDFQEWRRLVGDYFAAPPKVVHTRKALTGF